MLRRCAVPLPSGGVAAVHGCQHSIRLPVTTAISHFLWVPFIAQATASVSHPCVRQGPLARTLYLHRHILSKANEA